MDQPPTPSVKASMRVRYIDSYKETKTAVKNADVLPTLRNVIRVRRSTFDELQQRKLFMPFTLPFVIVNSNIEALMKEEDLPFINTDSIILQIFLDQLQFGGLAVLINPPAVRQCINCQAYLVSESAVVAMNEPLKDLSRLLSMKQTDTERYRIIQAGLNACGYAAATTVTIGSRLNPIPEVDNVLGSVIESRIPPFFLWEYDADVDCGVALIVHYAYHKSSNIQEQLLRLMQTYSYCVGHNPHRAAQVACPHLQNVANFIHRSGNINPSMQANVEFVLTSVMDFLAKKQIRRYACRLKATAELSTLGILSSLALPDQPVKPC